MSCLLNKQTDDYSKKLIRNALKLLEIEQCGN